MALKGLENYNYNPASSYGQKGIIQAARDAYKKSSLIACSFHDMDPDTLIHLKPKQIKNIVLEYIKKEAKQTAGKRTW